MRRPSREPFGTPLYRQWFNSWFTETPNGCLEWRGFRNGDGYGRTSVGGKNTTTHRVMWMLEHGDIPKGKLIRHLCSNKACAKLSHLAIGTPLDNARDTVKSGRHIDAPDLSQTKTVRINRYGMAIDSPEFKAWFYSQTKLNANGCLEWQKARNKAGYGLIGIGDKSRLAHRIACQIEFGHLDNDKVIMHKCHNKICVNVKHLKSGTYAENNMDTIQAGNQNHPVGEAVWTAKLTASDVLEIRAIYPTGKYSHRELGLMYGVSKSCIKHIINRETWKHLKAGSS